MCKKYKRAQVMINACDDYKAVSLMHFVCGFAARAFSVLAPAKPNQAGSLFYW